MSIIYLGKATPASGSGGSGEAVWGEITGTLADQTDLADALSAKQDVLTAGTGIDITNNVISATGGGSTTATSVENKNTAVGATNPLNFWEGTSAEYESGGGSTTYYNWESGGELSFIAGTIPSNDYTGVAYGNGLFVAVGYNAYGDSVCVYSTDGETWTAGTIQSGEYFGVTYGNSLFVAVGNSACAYSTDGQTWTAGTIQSGNYHSVTYGNGLFVAVGYNACAYSTDGETWTAGTIPSNDYTGVTYGNGLFVAVGNDACAYSTDGQTWTAGTIPSGWYNSVAYGNSLFVAVGNDACAYSTDGETWTAGTIQSGEYFGVTYGNSLFVAVGYDSFSYAAGDITLSVFTTSYTPTTSDIVYSAPSTQSALTITAVGTGTITLSDTNTYDYNASGNQTVTQTIGQAHPDWICMIEGVGIKKGSTTIASIAPTVDQTYNASSTNAQSGVAVAGGISDTLGTIETALAGV